jgi:hypothetical protein
MQMLLFQSPVNQQREAAGRLTINGIWLSGVGTLPEISPGIDFMIFTDEPAACGLARLAGLSIAPPAIPPAHAWAAGKQVLILWTELLAPVLHADLYHWAEALQKLEQRMTGLVDGLAQYRQSCLELYPCNGECYRLTAANLWRFWRRPRKMSHYLV